MKRRVRVDAAWSLAGRLTATLAIFGANVVLARVLTVGDFGIYTLATSIVAVTAFLARMGLAQTNVRVVAQRLSHGLPEEASLAGRRAALLATGIATVVAVVLGGPLGAWAATNVFDSQAMADVMPLVGLWAGTEGVRLVYANTFLGLGDVRNAMWLGDPLRSVALAATVGVTGMAVASISLQAAVGLTAAVSFGTAAAAFVLSQRALRRLVTHPPAPPDPADRPEGEQEDGDELAAISWSGLFLTSYPLMVSSLGGMFTRSGDLWIAGAVLSEDEVAAYGAALRLVLLLIVPLLVVSNIVPPRIVAAHARRDTVGLERVLRSLATAALVPTLAGFVVFAAFGEQILGLVFGSFARDAATPLTLLALAQVVTVYVGVGGIALVMTGHRRVPVVVLLGGSAFLLALGPWAGRTHGMVGIAVVSAITTVSTEFLLATMCKRALGVWPGAHLSPRAAWSVLRHPLRQVLPGR